MLILIDLPFGSLALEQFSLLMSHNLSSKTNAGESNTWLLITRYSCKFHTAGLLCQTNPLLRVSSAGAPWGSEHFDISINFFPLTSHSELSALSSITLEQSITGSVCYCSFSLFGLLWFSALQQYTPQSTIMISMQKLEQL